MRKLLYILVLFPIMAIGQTQSENYIKTTTYKVATTDGITDREGNLVADSKKTINVTYFDGLGRPIQQIANKQSATGRNIVTHIEYDEFGREVKEYLPYIGNSSLDFSPSALTDVIDFYGNPNIVKTGNPNFEATGNPYSEKEIEQSPLNRIYKMTAPGNDWLLGSGHEIKMDYQTNSEGEVKYYKANAVWNATLNVYNPNLVTTLSTGKATYEANQLYKTIIKDENWKTTDDKNNTTEEFKDKSNQLVLKRSYNAGVVHDTYFVYDQFDNLTYVIPPLTTNSSINELNKLCYQYKYDYRNRLVEKKLPAKEWEYIAYDQLDRPVANGPFFTPWGGTDIGWVITKYDVYNRVVYTAWMSSPTVTESALSALQNLINQNTQLNEIRQLGKTLGGIPIDYTNLVIPSDLQPLTINYYDSYVFPGCASIPTDVEGQSILNNVKTLPTGNWVRTLTNISEKIGETNTTFYDDLKSVPLRIFTTNHLGGFTQVDNKIDFTMKSLFTLTTHKRVVGSTVLSLRDDFTYSEQERLLTHIQTINGGIPQLINQNSYDELGQLISKNVGQSIISPLQEVNYSYNIRGWLKSINDNSNLPQGSNSNDLFEFKLSYNDSNGGTALFNGNISETYWKSKSDNILRKYKYTYDNLNRLIDANYSKPGVSNTDSYREKLSYDKNGNIMSVLRNGNLDANNSIINKIDDLVYTYNGNQLQKVIDKSNSPQGFKDDLLHNLFSDDYIYDTKGNLKKDENKGITAITYNHLNLPTLINFGSLNKIEYLYNAAGQKLQKKVTDFASGTTTTLYLNGFQYKNNVLAFFPHSEGYVNNTVVNGNNTYSYVFNYKDHLGNIRMSYALDPIAANGIKILEENHYYPFGLKQINYNSNVKIFVSTNVDLKISATNSTNDINYKHKYNDKELQSELGFDIYDYGARNYDPTIGRFFNIDRMSEIFMNLSPYQYAGNTPTFFIDVNGEYIDISDPNGTDSYRYDHGETQKRQSDGSYKTIDASEKLSDFVFSTVAALNSLENSGETGKGLIDKFSGSDKNVSFEYRDLSEGGNQAVFAGEHNKKENTIFFDNQKAVSSFVEGGVYMPTPDFVVVGHELAHLTGPKEFAQFGGRWFGDISRSEFRASHYENLIRQESGLPLRTHYASSFDVSIGKIVPNSSSTLIDRAGNSVYYNTPQQMARGDISSLIRDGINASNGRILTGRYNYYGN